MSKNKLQIEQMEQKLWAFDSIQKITAPPSGWIKAIRTALGMSLQQMANRSSISRQSARDIELREQEGTISIKALRQAADALDMKLVYGVVPKDGSLEALIDRKARKLATEIVMRTSNTMKLEDQENSDRRIKKAVEDRTEIIKQEMPKALWD